MENMYIILLVSIVTNIFLAYKFLKLQERSKNLNVAKKKEKPKKTKPKKGK